MIEILKETEQRLVMALGRGGKRRARFVLDKESGQAWFERRSLLPSRTVQTALSDIAAIEAAGHRLIIVTKSGTRHLFAGDPDSVREAAGHLNRFVALAETMVAPAPPAAARWPRLAVRGGLAVVVLALLAFAGFKLPDLF